jgi:hypothetical protein
MKPSKRFKPNCIYRDKAGTRYTITYKPEIHGYHMVRLQPNDDRICNSGVVFHRWLSELKCCGSLREEARHG